MAITRFLDFIVISSADTVSFAEFEGSSPLWVIDRKLFAGQPSLSVATRTRGRTTTTTIVLTGARYPGTNLSGDFSIEISLFPGDENQSPSQDVTLTLAFGNASFDWEFEPIDTDPQTQIDTFLEWLKKRTDVTAQISIAGNVATLANDGSVDFGPATSATLRLVPGIMTVEGGTVCTSNVAGVTFTGSSLSVSANPSHTDLVVQATSPLSVPVPSPTPLGDLSPRSGFSVVTVHASETRQSATFSSASSATLYVLELLGGVTDVEGRPVQANLNAGEVDFDLSTVPPQIRINASGPPASAYLLSAGVGLRVPFSPDFGFASINLSMSHSGTAWQVVQAIMPLGGVVLPLGDAMTEAVDSGVILSLLPVGTPPDAAANPSWLVIGPPQPGDVRLRVTPAVFNVIRPTDLLALQFRFDDLALQAIDGQVPEVVIATPGQAGTLSVVFPPQHMAEEAYYEGAEGLGQKDQTPPDPIAPDPLGTPPIAIRLAGETRLAFAVPGDRSPKPLTLDSLLDWSEYTLVPSPPASMGNGLTTSIELPYRLMLSPDAKAGFANTNFSSTDSDRAALWQARLGMRRVSTNRFGAFFVDERKTPPVAIVGSPDYVPGNRPPDSSMLPFNARASLTRSDRYDLTERGQKRPQRLTVNRLMLSTLGGWLDSHIAWDDDRTGLTAGNDVAEWRHVVAQGRDQYVRVVRLGFLFPLGHRASWVKVTERKFTGGFDATGGNPAYLIERDFVIVTQPVVTYASPPRDLPFVTIELLTLTTPTLDAPQGIDNTLRAFWLNLRGDPFRFHIHAIDLTGQSTKFDAPAIFVRADGLADSNLMDAIGKAYDSPKDPAYTVSALAGQKVAFAPPSDTNAGDTTLEVESLRFKSGVRPANAVAPLARAASRIDPASPVRFTIPRAMWDASIAGGSAIGTITGPPITASADVTIVPHDRGVVLAVSGASPQPLPQSVFDVWSAQNAAGNAMGPPIGFAFPTTGGRIFPFQFASVTLNDAGVVSVTAHVDSGVGADLQRYFQPRDDVLHLLPHQAGTVAKPIIGGDAALAAMRADIASTFGENDFIYILSWHCNIDFELVPGDPTSTLRSLLSSRASDGVQIRAMLWAGDPVPAPPTIIKILIPRVSVPWQLAKDFAKMKTSRVVNEPAVKFINGLSASGNDTAAILDDRHLRAGSHHQKVVVIGSGGKLIAYVGGIEFNRDRVPPPLADELGSPLFDISVRLQDAGAFPVLETFLTRWFLHPDKGVMPLRGASLGLPLPSGGSLAVQITHTYGRGFPFSSAVQTASTALANGIKSARQFLYMEDQYFVGSLKMASAIRDALSSNPGLVGIVVIAAEDSVIDTPDVGFRRRAFIGPIVAAFPRQFLVFERLGGGSTTGATAYVHSKLLIVDDEVAFIGSVNSNRRSWFHDSEIDATILDTTGPGGTTPGTRGWVRDFRCDLWSRHLNVSTAALGHGPTDIGLWRGVMAGTMHGTSVRPYDATTVVPRYKIKGVPVPDAVLDKAWDTIEDPT
jgi:PLD-like domain